MIFIVFYIDPTLNFNIVVINSSQEIKIFYFFNEKFNKKRIFAQN